MLPYTILYTDIPMRCDRGYCQEEWLSVNHCILQETLSLLRHHICRIVSFIAARLLAFALECAVDIVVCEGVEKEVLMLLATVQIFVLSFY